MMRMGEQFTEGANVYNITQIIFQPSAQYPYAVVDGEFVETMDAQELPKALDPMIGMGSRVGTNLAYLRQEIKLIRDWARLVREEKWREKKGAEPLPQRLAKLCPKVKEYMNKYTPDFPESIASRLWGDYHEAFNEAQEALSKFFKVEGDDEVPF